MLETALPEFAVAGDRGIDLFRRHDDPSQKRVHFECLACWRPDGNGDSGGDSGGDGNWQIYQPGPSLLARADAALARFRANAALHDEFALADAARYPRADNPQARLEILQYLEFLRIRLVAGITLSLFEEKFARDPALTLRHHGETTTALKLLLDFNLTNRAGLLLEPVAARLVARVNAPGFVESRDQMTGFSLRLLGDLHLRRDEPGAAFTCFEAALSAGDNPFRRRKAIEAAKAAGDREGALRHLRPLMRDGTPPPDLAATLTWAEGGADPA